MKACLTVALVLTISAASVGQSQSNETKRRDSVAFEGFERRGGFVNFVSGEGRCICVAQPSAQSKQPLTNGDTIELNDGRAELVLIPGYYLRLSAHTTVRLLDLNRDNLKIEITKGSAIIEIPIEDAVQLPPQYQELKDRFFNIVTVITPGGEYAIFKAGGYRFDATSSRESRVRVVKGAVAAGGHILKEGSALMMTGAVSLDAGDKNVDDPFDKWNRERAAALVQANKSLKHSEWYKQMDRGHGYIEVLDDKQTGGGTSAHVVSARNSVAGFVESGVSVKSGEGDWRELKSDAQLADGDRVRTSPNARAEIRPYPDFDFYLNGNSEILYGVNEDEDVSIEIIKGPAALFVSETRVKRAERNALTVSVNNKQYTIRSAGYYRFNVFSSSESELLVYSGSVVANGEIGSGKRIVVRGESRVTSSFDKESRDSFDIWSDRRNARTVFTPRKWWHAGLWFLNPETSEYTFVPGGRVCKSPYGGSYSTSYLLNRTTQRVRSSDNPLNLWAPDLKIKVP
jgi:hypothetical protein